MTAERFKRHQRHHTFVRPAVALTSLAMSLLLFGAATLWQGRRVAHAPNAPPSASAITTVAPTPSPILDPIQIAALRARSYSASPIVLDQNLPAGSGYTSQVVSYQSDGLTIYALKATPIGTPPAGGWPVVILNHGYSDPATYQTNGSFYQPFVAALAQAGYVVYKPDFRGHGRSQGQAEGGHFSPVYAYDVLNLIASLKQTNDINPARLGLFGHSMGGHVNLRTIVVSSDVKATVMLAGVVGDFNDILYNWPNSPMPGDRPTALVAGRREALLAKFGDPKANPEFWRSAAAINYVDAVKGSVFIAHDQNDSTVPKAFSEHLNTSLMAADKDVTYKLYPGDDHLFTRNRAAVLKDIIDFLTAKL